ncbi:MAG: polyprenyl synthetase family protein [Alphaproteobacteria bacterium]
MQDTSPDALERLRALVGEDMNQVNALIVERMHSPVPLIPQLAGHIVAAGGKRLRPLLTLASARLCDYRGDHHLGLAACVEFIHTATLLHDDVVDESDLRRGRPTANALWSNQASVLVGDFLFSRAFQLMVSARSLEVLRILAEAAATIAEGEIFQLTTANRPETSEDAYLQVIRGKTAALFAAATRIGAVIAERPAADADALDAFGLHLGLAFQLVDDVLDYSAREQTLGKTVGDDFREGKVTLPVILAYGRGDAEERRFWERTIGRQEQQDGDLARAILLMQRHRTIDETLERARRHTAQAAEALARFPASPVRTALLDVADFCVDRAY